MTDEKRKAPRHAIWFPMQMDTSGDVIMGISRDLSEVGVMMVAAAKPEPGAKVTMTMSIPGDEVSERKVTGTIVRVSDNDADSEGLWKHKVAVEFDERIDELDELLVEVARQSRPPAEP
ncbi:MAG: PilZ domain-containing protein [Deltaproteobacteria bacterium]|nr:PilZ domain-containing protein [Deltaproteobacteria bacterium]